MPFYEFECAKCKKNVSLKLSVKEHDARNYKCPECHSGDIKQIISHVQVQTSKKS
ncbi:MAG: zinc ribbon domain-containing protein [Nitrospinae bacterium]|nr:zinc ribbon domain-containing protein [Nitrospinota bacterium]